MQQNNRTMQEAGSMSTRLKGLFSLPNIEREDTANTASMLNAMAWTALILTLLLIPFFLLASAPLALFGILVSTLLLELATLYLIHHRRIKGAALLLTFGGWVVLFLPAFFQGGLTSPFTIYSVVMVAIAMVILGSGYGILLGSLTFLGLSVMFILGNLSFLPQWIPTATPGQWWLSLLIVLCSVGILLFLAVRRLLVSTAHAREIEQHLEESDRELENARSILEQRETERASYLERRVQQMQAELEIASSIAATRDMDTLLEQIVSLVSERLGYQSASIFLADRSAQSLSLRASNREAGKRMVERGFMLKAGNTSLVGNAADTLHSQLSTGVIQDAFFQQEALAAGFPAAEFPENGSTEIGSPDSKKSRSELALPLVSGGRLIGVLDVQNEEKPEEISGIQETSGFDQENIAALQMLVENVAAAIENTQMLEEKQQTIEAIQRAYSSMSRETWQKLVHSQPEYGYQCSVSGEPVISTGVWSPEMLRARDAGKVIRADEFTLAIPIKIREQVAGVVKLRKPEATGGWGEEEIELVETLSERLSTALESAQLYDETRRRAERERLTGEITARVRASNDPQVILQTAVRELRRALKVDHARLLVQSSPEQTGPGVQPGTETPVSPNLVLTGDKPAESNPVNVDRFAVDVDEENQWQEPSELDNENDSSVQPAGQD
jgi:GAF domain-containing protein